ncbi:MAG: 3D (Asp-Asp-Asp) domain-containing protein [Sphingobacteriales bacterium]|jgi:3D (Asp-Asp-Asp) domain-containing protein
MSLTPNLILILIFINLASCTPEQTGRTKKLKVTATAYNNLPAQTNSEHFAIGAWGDSLKPGMKVIAVSRDLIDSGLVHNTRVYIKGFDEPFLVKDKMNARWIKKIDIYMGLDRNKALKWGKKKVNISWEPPKENSN